MPCGAALTLDDLVADGLNGCQQYSLELSCVNGIAVRLYVLPIPSLIALPSSQRQTTNTLWRVRAPCAQPCTLALLNPWQCGTLCSAQWYSTLDTVQLWEQCGPVLPIIGPFCLGCVVILLEPLGSVWDSTEGYDILQVLVHRGSVI